MFLPVCVLSLVLVGSNAGLVPITPCKSSDTKCLLSSSQDGVALLGAGIPDLKVPAADPLVLGDINGDQGDLKLQFRDLKVVGTSKCKILDVVRHIEESSLTVDMECPITATGSYSIGGKLLIIPAEGSGKIEVKTDKIKLHVEAKVAMVDGTSGKKHWQITDIKHSYEPEERIYIDLENLFNGDEKKAKPVLEILNNSWKELISEIGKPIINEVIAKAVVIINKFLLAVPADELEIN